MNANEIINLKNTCANISDNIRALFPSLNLHFLIHTPESKQDAVSTVLAKLNGHPAFNEAFQTLKAWTHTPASTSFLGLSEGQESIVLSFKTRPRTLGFISVDVSLYEELYDAIQAVHFEMSIFLDTYSAHLKKPLHVNGNIFAHTSSQIAACKVNLKSDIYSVLQLLREGQYDAPALLAQRRANEVITPQTNFSPEEFAFPIALDVINYTVEQQISSSVASRNPSPLLSQYQLAEQITNCFDDDNIQSWIHFAGSCQLMAWSGFTPSQILGAAINTSTNPIVKAIGHMIGELTNQAPVEESHLPSGYNPFLAEEINQIRHERMIEETFEMIMFHVMEADSHLPLLRVANNQNEGLIKGKISGWCANALHASAKAYMGAKDRGIPPVQAARLEFQSAQQQQNWKLLKDIGQYVVSMQRQAQPLDLPELLKWVNMQPESKHVSDSLTITISDPQYTRNLDTYNQPQAILNTIPLKKIDADKVHTSLQAKTKLPPTPPPQAPRVEPQGFTFESDD